MLREIWGKWFDHGVIITVKMRFCIECTDKITCNDRNNQINENKEFETDLNILKRDILIQFGHMLPYYKEKDHLFEILLQVC